MVISIVLGGVSAWAIDQHLDEKTHEIESRSKLEQLALLVAARDLSRDTVLEEADVVVELFPEKWSPDDAIISEHSDTLMGKRLLSDLRAGQPLLHSHLQDTDAPGVAHRLPSGYKAVSVTVDPSSAATGLIRQGDHVDLFVSLDHQGKRLTKLLLESVEVLGIGHFSNSLHRTETAVSQTEANITIAVKYQEAVRVIAAREAGSISAVLSSSQHEVNKKGTDLQIEDVAALLGLPTQPMARVVPIMYGDRLSSENDDLEIGPDAVGSK